jgi:hypothetical protein
VDTNVYARVFFFRHSLLATQLVSEINEELGLQFKISDMLQHSTLQSMVSFIENAAANSTSVALDLPAAVQMHAQDKFL